MSGELRWYLQREGKATGPYSLDDVKTQIRQGLLLANDLIFQEGASQWRKASDWTEMASETFSESRGSFSGLFNLPKEDTKNVSEDWIVLTRHEEGRSIRFEQQGPHKTEKIREMLRAGKIKPSDHVWRKGLLQWAAIFSRPEFSPELWNAKEEAAAAAAAAQGTKTGTVSEGTNVTSVTSATSAQFEEMEHTDPGAELPPKVNTKHVPLDLKPEVPVEAKSDPKTEPKFELKPEHKTDPKIEIMPELKQEKKPEPAPAKPAEPVVAKPVEPVVVKPVEPIAVQPVAAQAAEPVVAKVEPLPAKPAEPVFVKPEPPPAVVKPVPPAAPQAQAPVKPQVPPTVTAKGLTPQPPRLPVMDDEKTVVEIPTRKTSTSSSRPTTIPTQASAPTAAPTPTPVATPVPTPVATPAATPVEAQPAVYDSEKTVFDKGGFFNERTVVAPMTMPKAPGSTPASVSVPVAISVDGKTSSGILAPVSESTQTGMTRSKVTGAHSKGANQGQQLQDDEMDEGLPPMASAARRISLMSGKEWFVASVTIVGLMFIAPSIKEGLANHGLWTLSKATPLGPQDLVSGEDGAGVAPTESLPPAQQQSAPPPQAQAAPPSAPTSSVMHSAPVPTGNQLQAPAAENDPGAAMTKAAPPPVVQSQAAARVAAHPAAPAPQERAATVAAVAAAVATAMPAQKVVTWNFALPSIGKESLQLVISGFSGQVLDVPAVNMRMEVPPPSNGQLQVDPHQLKLPEGEYLVQVFQGSRQLARAEQSTVQDADKFEKKLAAHRKQIAYDQQQEKRTLLRSLDNLQKFLVSHQTELNGRSLSSRSQEKLLRSLNSLARPEARMLHQQRNSLMYPSGWASFSAQYNGLHSMLSEISPRKPASKQDVEILKKKIQQARAQVSQTSLWSRE